MLDFISNTKFFSGINQEYIKNILECIGYKNYKYERSELLFDIHEGYKAGIVLSGTLDLVRISEDGREVIEKRYIKGDSFVFNFDLMEDLIVISKSKSHVLFLNVDKIFNEENKSCKYRALLMENIIHVLDDELKYLYLKSKIYSQLSLRKKILTFLEYEYESLSSNEIVVKYNKNDLSKFLACNRSALSRELSIMEKEKILEIEKGKFILLNTT